MSSSADTLVMMANQIARNLAAQGDERAIMAMTQHIRDFWDPRMKAAILAIDRAKLTRIAAAAVGRLELVADVDETIQARSSGG